MHILPPVTAEGFDGSHHPRFSECSFTLYPNDKILDHSNLKDFADDKIIETYVTNFVRGRVENIVGKGENACYQYFLLFTAMFSLGIFVRVVKSRDCVKELTLF